MITGEGSLRERLQVVLPVAGALDVIGATAALKGLLQLRLRAGERLVLDLSGLEFMDTMGIRLILQARDHALRHGAGFAIVAGPPAVMRVLAMVGLDEQLDIVGA